MQRNRNRNIMVNKTNMKHITVTGFAGDNKATAASKLKGKKLQPKKDEKLPDEKLESKQTDEKEPEV